MRFSYNWIQSYFDEKLPKPNDIGELLTMKSFEVESVDELSDDFILDIDILPNRAHDCLSHRGIAKEVSIITGIPVNREFWHASNSLIPRSNILEIEIVDSSLCGRYTAAIMKEIKVGPSPDWLKNRLVSLGLKSINNVVDAANFVMLDTGQPLHVFDRDKLVQSDNKYKIKVRRAAENEKIEALDGEIYELDKNMIVIADGNDDSVLGIAGIKGGVSSGIDEKTTNIIIESANFDPLSIRKTAQLLKLKTDAAKRFENGMTKDFTDLGIGEIVKLIQKVAGGDVEGYCDEYPNREEEITIAINEVDVNKILGSLLTKEDVEEVLKQLNFKFSDHFIVRIPSERIDVVLKEDLVEEIGRIYGYDKIKPNMQQKSEKKPMPSKVEFYKNKIRKLLVEQGFSEVYTYSFTNEGELELENPLADDKKMLRSMLRSTLRNTVIANVKHKELLGIPWVQIFEIGKVFTKEGEYLALGIATEDKNKNAVQDVINILKKELCITSILPQENVKNSIEINLDKLIEKLPEPKKYEQMEKSPEFLFKPYSQYPFILRDIAIWVPGDISVEQVSNIISKNAGKELIRIRLFDTFEKENNTSYAFRLVFQSMNKTLKDEQINSQMKHIEDEIHKNEGWKVR